MSTIDLKFNIKATLLVIPCLIMGVLISPDTTEEASRADKFFHELPYAKLLEFSFLIAGCALAIFTFKFLYNKVISEIFPVRNITLAETYALMLFMTVFFGA
jgi:hypothetical protein